MAYDTDNIFAKFCAARRQHSKCTKMINYWLSWMSCLRSMATRWSFKGPCAEHSRGRPSDPWGYDSDCAKVSLAVKQAFDAPGIMVAQLNGPVLTVFHLHFHVLPRHDGLEFRMHARDMEDLMKLEAHAERVRACL